MQVVGGPLKIWICSLVTAGGEVPATGDVLWEDVPSEQEQHRHIRISSARCRGQSCRHSTLPLLSSTAHH